VSDALHQQDPSIPVTENNAKLQDNLRARGYSDVKIDPQRPLTEQLQPGDVIVGIRENGMPGHAAIYKGNGTVYENDSNTGTIRGDGDVHQFEQDMHDKEGHFNKNGFDHLVILRKGSASA
jgi:hypothetical protein